MTKLAHITSRPNHAVGDRVIGLCGKEFTVKVLWADIPAAKPICRACVDTALGALTDADRMIEYARVSFALVDRRFGVLREGFNERSELDRIAEIEEEFRDEQDAKALAEAERVKALTTCICIWATPENFEENPDCPIHGGELDAIGVEVPDA